MMGWYRIDLCNRFTSNPHQNATYINDDAFHRRVDEQWVNVIWYIRI